MPSLSRVVLAGALVMSVLALQTFGGGAGAIASPGAGQIAREVSARGSRIEFRFRFQDARQVTRSLSFALPAKAYAAARKGLARPDGQAAERRLHQRVEDYVSRSRRAWREALGARLEVLAETVPEGVRLIYGFEDGRLQWQVEGRGLERRRLDAVAQRLQRRIRQASRRLLARERRRVTAFAEQARDAVYRDLAYTRDPGLGADVLRPDYRRIARNAANYLEPLARAIAARSAPAARARIGLALAFLQTIPYDRLDDRNLANGTGFAVPAQLLHLNRGDCDSKATALAALLEHLAPAHDTAMILLPGHAVLGIDLPPRPGERTIEVNGRSYVLMEPAGPAVLPIGRVSRASRRLLADGQVLSVVAM